MFDLYAIRFDPWVSIRLPSLPMSLHAQSTGNDVKLYDQAYRLMVILADVDVDNDSTLPITAALSYPAAFNACMYRHQ